MAATPSGPASETCSTRCCGAAPARASPAGTTTCSAPGRPGWHIECTAISLAHLGHPFDIKGGGSDLVFPHHEMSAVQANAMTGGDVFARLYVHQAMVGYRGEKMSKSQGNLVLVSRLRTEGVDPMAIRLVLLAQHYRTAWEYTDDLLSVATARHERWREALSVNEGVDATATIAAVRARRGRRPLDAAGARGGRRVGRRDARRRRDRTGCPRPALAHPRRGARPPLLSGAAQAPGWPGSSDPRRRR